MASTSFSPTPDWDWRADVKTYPNQPDDANSSASPEVSHHEPTEGESKRSVEQEPTSQASPNYPPRTCRICLEVVQPTYHTPSSNLPGILQSSVSVSYISADQEAGRLIRPCKCKGSSRYVHEGCLQAWRHADKDYGKRNYWQCPTCGFRYRLARMGWGRALSSTVAQLVLTTFVLLFTMFVLGFIADPIINFYLDPYSAFSSTPLKNLTSKIEPVLSEDNDPTWMEHFVKGLASLGLLSFVKVIFALSPWQWWNLRSSGILRVNGRAGVNGRDRLANISWIVVMIGVATFLWVSHVVSVVGHSC